jgi:hypothetical protein
MSYTLGYHEDGPDSYVIALGGFLVTDDPDSPFGTPANLGGFLLAMLFILLLSIFMTLRLGQD